MFRRFQGPGRVPNRDEPLVETPSLERKTVIAIGPGLGTEPRTVELVRRLFDTVTLPMVVDADGLNALAGSGFRKLDNDLACRNHLPRLSQGFDNRAVSAASVSTVAASRR